ncbi:hypothetical protein HYPSUDRAFT_168029 [Hypholoma sublateritium FD-334 SS-4]|uniref:G-protein coupled receptors family 1 profile domain-containing protein n=1 Tax=Hypholoma sublateritium (strain FD-334 SS-4) TaxID=945553 RepID=A0A0D2KYH0_HYPSF|nr:hypothetical protein HYPSUDRAFT_168029 [Hypholoma sublateritium FD-334 SS-4]
MSSVTPAPLPSTREEQYILVGLLISLAAYGIAFVLFVQCIDALRNSSISQSVTSRMTFFVYTCVMFLIGTAYIMANTSYKVLAYTTHRDFPGGPVNWININYSSPTTLASNICAVVSSWGADGLLLYRCFIIYSNSLRPVRFILILPIVLYIGELVSGVLLIVQVSHSPATIWNSVNLGLPYFALAAACNVTITLTIATPLLLHRRSLMKTFGRNNDYSKPYTSAAAILVESSAVYAIVAVIFIGFYSRNNPISHVFLSTLCQVQVIAPFLIILRVATKRAWTASTGRDIVSATASRPEPQRLSMPTRRHNHDVIQFSELHAKRASSPSTSIDISSPISKVGDDSDDLIFLQSPT